MMKIKHKNKTYEYDTGHILVENKTKNKIKIAASKEGMSMKAFIHKLIDEYEG